MLVNLLTVIDQNCKHVSILVSGGFVPHKHQGLVPLIVDMMEPPQKRKQEKESRKRNLMFLEGGNLKVSYQQGK